MKTHTFFSALTVLFLLLCSFRKDTSNNWWYNGTNEKLVTHTFYALEYSEEHEQAIYVTYILTKEMLESEAVRRSDNFREDPMISTGSATLADYAGSGYDRGHLCPAADMAFDRTAMSESFYMSNMSPQHPSFNRGIWKKLEEQVRAWAIEYDTLVIYSGPVLDSIIGYIGSDSVAVPYAYYKTIYSPLLKQSAAYIIPNAKSTEGLMTFAVTIDSVENRINRDLYSGYPEAEQQEFEAGSRRLYLK